MYAALSMERVLQLLWRAGTHSTKTRSEALCMRVWRQAEAKAEVVPPTAPLCRTTLSAPADTTYTHAWAAGCVL